MESSNTNTWKWGKTTTYTTLYKATFPVYAGPHKTVQVESFVYRGKLDVPFVMHSSSKRTGVKVETSGCGVSSWDLHHSISTVN